MKSQNSWTSDRIVIGNKSGDTGINETAVSAQKAQKEKAKWGKISGRENREQTTDAQSTNRHKRRITHTDVTQQSELNSLAAHSQLDSLSFVSTLTDVSLSQSASRSPPRHARCGLSSNRLFCRTSLCDAVAIDRASVA